MALPVIPPLNSWLLAQQPASETLGQPSSPVGLDGVVDDEDDASIKKVVNGESHTPQSPRTAIVPSWREPGRTAPAATRQTALRVTPRAATRRRVRVLRGVGQPPSLIDVPRIRGELSQGLFVDAVVPAHGWLIDIR